MMPEIIEDSGKKGIEILDRVCVERSNNRLANRVEIHTI
jgi:hypothetical protein